MWLTRFNSAINKSTDLYDETEALLAWIVVCYKRMLLFRTVWKLKCENMCGTSKVRACSVRDSLNFSYIDHIHRLFSVWKTCLRRVHATREPLKRSIPYDVERESTVRNKGRVSQQPFDKAAFAFFYDRLLDPYCMCDKRNINYSLTQNLR